MAFSSENNVAPQGIQPFSPLATPTATREVLERHGHSAKYSLGQNFLVNDRVVGKILALSEAGADDVVLEVGPGIGTLSLALLSRVAHVFAIERDDALLPILQDTTQLYADKFTLIHMDALNLAPDALNVAAPKEVKLPNKFIANLPYNVAATLILKYFQELSFIEEATVMVQAEVADRIAAKPGTKTYGAFTVKLSLYADVADAFLVKPGSFMPAPRVNSSVIKLVRNSGWGLSQDELTFCAQVVDAAFAQRRKTLRNSMSASGFEKQMLDEAFEEVGIDGGRRAETLETNDFIALSSILRTKIFQIS